MMRIATLVAVLGVALLSGCVRHCEVHGDELQSDHLRTSYGLYLWPAGYLEARRTQFPHACTVLTGGCFVDPDDTEPHRVKYCPSCRRAEAAWEANLPQPGRGDHQVK